MAAAAASISSSKSTSVVSRMLLDASRFDKYGKRTGSGNRVLVETFLTLFSVEALLVVVQDVVGQGARDKA